MCAVLALAGCRSARTYADRANALYARGDYSAASLNYRKALQKKPTDGELYYRLALAEIKQNKGAEAFGDLTQAVRLAPGNRAARAELENLVLRSYLTDPKRPKLLYDTLVKLSDQWLAENPQSPEGLRIKGYLAMVDRRPQDAVVLLEHARQLNPTELKITLGLMDAYVQSGRPEDAEQVGREAIARDKAAAEVYDALYRLYAVKRPADAERILLEKIHNNQQEGSYRLQLASHYARLGKKAEMRAALQDYLAEPNSDPNKHLKAGEFYSALGDGTKAIEQYQLGLAGNPENAPMYQDRIARALISAGNRDEALKLLNKTVAQDPKDKEAQSLRAALLISNLGENRRAEGIQDFQKLVEKNPDDLSLRYVLSKALLETGDLAGARLQLLEIVKKNPRFLDGQLSLADIAFKQGRLAEAAQHAQAAVDSDPDNFKAQLLLGTALLRHGDLDHAAAVLDRLSRQAPESIDARLEMANLDLVRGRLDKAETSFAQILQTHPGDLRAIAGLANIDIAQHRPEQALAMLEKQLANSHDAPEIRYLMAVTALKAGKYDVAIDHLKRLTALGSVQFYMDLAQVYRLRGDLRNAIATMQQAVALNSRDPRPASMLSYLLELDNRRQEAKAQAQRALSLKPNDPGAMNNFAYLLADTGDSLDEALKLAKNAVSKVPGEPNFEDTLGFIYLKRGQSEDALNVFDQLVRRYPKEPSFAYHMGVAWYQRGEPARAKAMLSRALELRPSQDTEREIQDLMTRLN